MSDKKQMAFNFTPPVSFPVSPRAAGRFAARARHNVLTNPHPENSWAWHEWRGGWGSVWGIPENLEDRAEYLRIEFLRLWNVLTEIRDNPDVPQAVRAKAARELNLDKEMRDAQNLQEG